MKTVSKRKRRLSFETAETIRNRAIIVEVDPHGYTMSLRLKGQRTRYEVSFAGIFWYAAQVAADRKRRERKTGKKVSHE